MTPPRRRIVYATALVVVVAAGALVLGYGFLWSDIACYTAGVALAAGISAVPASSKAAVV